MTLPVDPMGVPVAPCSPYPNTAPRGWVVSKTAPEKTSTTTTEPTVGDDPELRLVECGTCGTQRRVRRDLVVAWTRLHVLDCAEGVRLRQELAEARAELERWRDGRRRKGLMTVESVPDAVHYAAALVRAQGTEGGEEHDTLLAEAGQRLKAISDAASHLLAEVVVLRDHAAAVEAERDLGFSMRNETMAALKRMREERDDALARSLVCCEKLRPEFDATHSLPPSTPTTPPRKVEHAQTPAHSAPLLHLRPVPVRHRTGDSRPGRPTTHRRLRRRGFSLDRAPMPGLAPISRMIFVIVVTELNPDAFASST